MCARNILNDTLFQDPFGVNAGVGRLGRDVRGVKKGPRILWMGNGWHGRMREEDSPVLCGGVSS